MLRETHYDMGEELKEELLQYLYYYNHERPHQGINGDGTVNFKKKLLPN
jgi:transposase InsO family protein